MSINNESFIAVTAHFIDPKNETQLSSIYLAVIVLMKNIHISKQLGSVLEK
jgi:hypothetical protein